jgi:hypothetical protein
MEDYENTKDTRDSGRNGPEGFYANFVEYRTEAVI